MTVTVVEELTDHTLLGIPIRIRNGVVRTVIDGEEHTAIVRAEELAAAVMLARLRSPVKLAGQELRAIRKALGQTQAQFAVFVRVARESVSRWETDSTGMGEATEIAVRMAAAAILGKKAPAIDFDIENLVTMQLRPAAEAERLQPPVFELVTMKSEATREKSKHWDEDAVAA